MRRYTLPILCLLLALGGTPEASAQPCYPVDPTTYTSMGGTWCVEGDLIRQTNADPTNEGGYHGVPFNLLRFNQVPPDHFTIQADMGIPVEGSVVGWDAVGFAFRIQDPATFYRVVFFPGFTGSALRFERYINGSFSWIVPEGNQHVGFTPQKGLSYTMRLEVDGPVFTASIKNGVGSSFDFVLTGTDSLITGGKVGLSNDVGPGFFGNIQADFVTVDSDADGLADAVETSTGVFVDASNTGTDPNNPDTDFDGLLDGTEVLEIGCASPLLSDTDGDSIPDGVEVSGGTNPCSMDTDGDCLPDWFDALPLDPAVTASQYEEVIRGVADQVAELALDLFNGPNQNANMGRRNALSNKIREAANLLAEGDVAGALEAIESALARVDDGASPPDWLNGGPEKEMLEDELEILVVCLP